MRKQLKMSQLRNTYIYISSYKNSFAIDLFRNIHGLTFKAETGFSFKTLPVMIIISKEEYVMKIIQYPAVSNDDYICNEDNTV